MTVHLVTFSDESMSRSQEECEMSASRHGVDVFFGWTQDELRQTEWYKQNERLLSKPRGRGYWAWKPWLILAEMEYRSTDGDVVIYSDAGVEFINNVSHIIDRMDQDIFLFGNNWEHAHWCKRDVIDAIFSKETLPEYTHWTLPIDWGIFGKQVQASVIFFRVSDYSRSFVAEWLKWCIFEGGRLIDDSPSRLPNHPEFQEHRHDQAILTTLAYREGIRLHWWPAVYNRGGSPEFVYEKLPEYAGDDYPIIVSHHRRRNHEWSEAA